MDHTDPEFAVLTDQAREKLHEIALLIANEPDDRVAEVMAIVCDGMLDNGGASLSEDDAELLVKAVLKRKAEISRSLASAGRH
jgi:serine/threonine protein phosphatase PrpC